MFKYQGLVVFFIMMLCNNLSYATSTSSSPNVTQAGCSDPGYIQSLNEAFKNNWAFSTETNFSASTARVAYYGSAKTKLGDLEGRIHSSQTGTIVTGVNPKLTYFGYHQSVQTYPLSFCVYTITASNVVGNSSPASHLQMTLVSS